MRQPERPHEDGGCGVGQGGELSGDTVVRNHHGGGTGPTEDRGLNGARRSVLRYVGARK